MGDYHVNLGAEKSYNISARPGFNDTKFYPNDWIEYRGRYSDRLLRAYDNDNYSAIKREPFLTNLEKGEIQRFWISLKAYDLLPIPSRYFPTNYYWINSLFWGPDFADWLKDQTAYAIRKKFNSEYEIPEGFFAEPLSEYNSIYPFRGLIKFLEKDKEDYLISMEPVQQIECALKDFTSECIFLISDLKNFEIISDLEILASPKNSSCFNKEKDCFEPIYKNFTEKFSEFLVGKRCLVPVYPAGTRDTVIATVESSNTIRWCEMQCRQILDQLPESAIVMKNEKFIDKIKIIDRYDPLTIRHILRDIKKCGLQFPMNSLSLIFFNIMNDYFPCKKWSRFSIYQQREIYGYKPDQAVNPTRGYCLGMANHLVTILLIIIHRIAKKRTLHLFPRARISALIGNDDSDVCIFSKKNIQEVAECYLNEETSLLYELDIFFNRKKSFISYYGVFFEQYGHPCFKNKDSLLAIVIANLVCLGNIRIAKVQLSSILENWTGNEDSIQILINYLSSHYKFEFDENEGERDYYLGGWIKRQSYNLSSVLLTLPEQESDKYYKIFKFIRRSEKSPIMFKDVKVPLGANVTPFGSRLGLWGEHGDYKEFLQTRSSLNAFYKKNYSTNRNVEYLSKLLLKEWKRIYNKPLKDMNYWKLKDYIYKSLPCQIPEEDVLEYTNQGILAHRSYLFNNDINVANMTIKKLLIEINNDNIHSSSIKEEEYYPSPAWIYLQPKGKFKEFPLDTDTWSIISKDGRGWGFDQLWEFNDRVRKIPLALRYPKSYMEPPWRFADSTQTPVTDFEFDHLLFLSFENPIEYFLPEVLKESVFRRDIPIEYISDQEEDNSSEEQNHVLLYEDEFDEEWKKIPIEEFRTFAQNLYSDKRDVRHDAIEILKELGPVEISFPDSIDPFLRSQLEELKFRRDLNLENFSVCDTHKRGKRTWDNHDFSCPLCYLQMDLDFKNAGAEEMTMAQKRTGFLTFDEVLSYLDLAVTSDEGSNPDLDCFLFNEED